LLTLKDSDRVKVMLPKEGVEKETRAQKGPQYALAQGRKKPNRVNLTPHKVRTASAGDSKRKTETWKQRTPEISDCLSLPWKENRLLYKDAHAVLLKKDGMRIDAGRGARTDEGVTGAEIAMTKRKGRKLTPKYLLRRLWPPSDEFVFSAPRPA